MGFNEIVGVYFIEKHYLNFHRLFKNNKQTAAKTNAIIKLTIKRFQKSYLKYFISKKTITAKNKTKYNIVYIEYM